MRNSVVELGETPSSDMQGDYVRGRLVVTASDGSVLELDADDGDPNTYRITVRGDGAVSSVSVPWFDENVLPCLNGATGRELDGCQ